MSRSNHYRLCGCETVDEPVCWYHLKYGFDRRGWMSRTEFKPTRAIEGRRPWVRKARYPKYSIKTHMDGPPRLWWQEQHGKARRHYQQLLRRYEEPALPRLQDLVNLWAWF